MLNRIIEFSIKNKLLVGVFIAALIGYGGYQATLLPIDAVPDITNNQVQVITVAPSYGATDIERLVTFPVEQANSNIKGLKEIRSFSRFGLSLVTIVFDDETDIYWARQQVAERLQNVRSQIPSGIGTPELGPITTGLGEIYQYVVRPAKGYESRFDATELRTIQDWIVRRQLLGVKGVAEVSSFGGKLKQYEIAVSTSKLQSLGLTISDVFDAVEKNNQNTGGSYIEKENAVLFIRSEGLIGSMDDIRNISIKAGAGSMPVLLRDVADVRTGYATRYGAMSYNDQGEVAGAVVMMLKGANSNEVIANVRERIEQIRKTLPEGVLIEPFLDRTKMVNNAIGTVEQNLLEGALIVVFILVLFLGNFRAGLLVASVIPLAMLFAIIMMNTFGISGNLMSLGALDFGLIVDGAVIIVEAVMHQLSHSRKLNSVVWITRDRMDSEVMDSSKKMMNSAVFGQIIILIVYLPIFTLEGIEGKMFKPMAQTVAFALLGSFILSLTYIPMMSSLVISRKIHHSKNLSDRMMNRIENVYRRLLLKVLRIPKTALIVVMVIFMGSVWVLSGLGGEFIPALEEGDFAVETRVLTGSNLNTSIEYTQKAAGILKSRFPEVLKVVTKTGSGEVPTDPMPMEASDMMVILKDKKDWTSAKTFNELAEKMGEALSEIPGITAGFQYPVQMRFNELMTGARQDVVCKIFGENLDTLARYAAMLGKIANAVEGSDNVYVEPVTGIPQVIVEFDRAAIARYQLSIGDINRVINTAFAGQSAGQVFEGEKRFDIVVRLDQGQRKNLEDVRNLLIPTPGGHSIPLYQLASVDIKNGPNQIQREDAKRRIVVGLNVRGRDVQTVVEELKQKTESQIKFPSGYYVTYGGAFENLNAAKKRLLIAVPVSLALIFLLLYMAFNSLKHGLLIYSAIPLSAIGGIFFLALRGMPFSISAGVGFIALFGVAVLNGIVMIAEFNHLKNIGIHNVYRLVLKGSGIRLRPVLMTAFVASLGFLPMAISKGAGAEVQRPLATVVIGGLLIATLLTLFILPILYVLFESTEKVKVSYVKNTLTVLLLITVAGTANAQRPVSWRDAVDSAMKNNLTLSDSRLKIQYSETMTGTARDLQPAMLSSEYGQINSIYRDTRFGVSQALPLPAVVKSRKNILNEELSISRNEFKLTEASLRQQVTELFFTIRVLREKERLLARYDSLFGEFSVRAGHRLQAGESNLLEKATAGIRKENAAMQLADVRYQLSYHLELFNLLLNTGEPLAPEPGVLKIELLGKYTDTALLAAHPVNRLTLDYIRLAKAESRFQRSLFLPDIEVGYYNMSMKGTGADNVLYDASARFSSVQLGLGIPLFRGGNRARLNASITQGKQAEIRAGQTRRALSTEFRSALNRYRTCQEKVGHYEQFALRSAEDIVSSATLQFQKGEISYLEWVLLLSQAGETQVGYLNTLIELNQSACKIMFLTAE